MANIFAVTTPTQAVKADGSGNDIISFLRVKEGYVARLCPNFQEDGGCRDFTAGDWNSLSKFNMNDVTSYIKVWKVK